MKFKSLNLFVSIAFLLSLSFLFSQNALAAGLGSFNSFSIDPSTDVTTSTNVSGDATGGATQDDPFQQCNDGEFPFMPQTAHTLSNARYRIDSGTLNYFNLTVTQTGANQPAGCGPGSTPYTNHQDWLYSFDFPANTSSLSNGTHTLTIFADDDMGGTITIYGTFTVNHPMSGTLTASNCTITSGNSSCNTNLNWCTTNPQGTSSVTTPNNITVATGNCSTATYPIVPGPGDRTFYLYNNGQLLNQATATASCTSGTDWYDGACRAPIDCVWSAWSSWGSCSASCGGGTQTSTRTNTPPQYGGVACSGPYTQTQSCNTQACDACGTGSGSTPQNPQPTGTSACGQGTYSSSPADTSLAWNWSCGTVNSCSAPKYGCTIATDTNYNPSGPNNTWGCSGVCTNGATNYSTCVKTDGGWTDWSTPNPACGASGTQTRTCTNPAPANGGAQCSGSSTQPYTNPPCSVNGVCSTTHNNCSPGTSVDTTDTASTYNWSCNGSNGGTNDVCTEPKPAPTASLSASPTNVAFNGQSTLTWSSTNATSCIAYGPWSNASSPLGPSSGLTGSLTTNTTFQFQCTGNGQITPMQSVTVTVGAAPVNDLTASAPTQTAAVIGTALNFTSSITNGGNTTTGASFYNSLQVATGAGGTGAVTPLTAATPSPMSALAASASATATASYTFTGAAVTRSVRFCADNNTSMVGSITESNETNNCSAWTNVVVSATPTIDLTAAAPTPSAATANIAQTYTSIISNIGNASTGAPFSNFFQTATTANGGGTVTDRAPASMNTLAASGTATAISPSITFSSAGTYSIRACADKTSSAGGGVITESGENNNCSSWTNVTVAAAGCTPTSFSGSVSPTSVAPGGLYTMYCDYGVTSNSIFPIPGSYAPDSCVWVGFTGTGTRATFNCNADSTPGIFNNSCTISNTPIDPYCSRTDAVNPLTVTSVPPSCAVINASKVSIYAGDSSAITWSSSGCSGACVGTNFSTGGAPNSTPPGVSVTPVSTTTYTVTCGGAAETSSVIVTVKKKPFFIEN